MTDITILTTLLPLLKSHGVSKFSHEGLSVEFHKDSPQLKTLDDTQIIDETSLPPDLRTDKVTDYDTILNWSGSPDANETAESIPGTGDDPIGGMP